MPQSTLDLLVVDDSLESLELLAELLESYGHRVRTARTGAAALELLTESLPALVFLDLTLPDVAGVEVARAIRARWGSACRIVAVTGHSDVAHHQAALEAGCDGVIVKPIRIPQLEQWLNASEARS